MPVQRSTDVVEGHSERALTFGLGGLVAAAFGALLIYYQGMLVGLGWVLVLGGVAGIGYGIFCAMQVRNVTTVKVTCPYCSGINAMTEMPEKDVSCVSCHRMIPIREGRVLPVSQVRCGFCGHLNFYNETSVGLICESCDREIPIATAEGTESKKFFRAYTQQDDERPYELVLVAHGPKTEEVINTLQHMLALNRNQVKDMLNDLPVTLLTGIPKKKAEMLAAQLSVHDALAEYKPLS
ncbi:MAG TPA: hypothetical protein PLH94_08960 [Fimbriimonadaceae bacterium]|nr:hypothetical protein [Fimbriimonadaceae bacterium]